MRAFILGLVPLLILTASYAAADTYYVALDGDDNSGDGSEGQPWATIQHATNTGIGAEGGHTILVKDGVYSGSNYLNRGFASPVTIAAENDYRATLTNVDGGMEVIRVYVEGSTHITISGFVMTNLHPSYTCPNGRETYFLVHLQDVSDFTLENNILYGNNAPGTCNEVLKINRGGEGIYPRNILIRGNVFSEPANAGGSDLIDSVRPGEVHVTDNIFFGNPASTESQSFITIKRQAPADNPSTYRFRVQRNVFLNYSGKTDQAFLQFGEDGYAEMQITNGLVENNLFIGNSAEQMAAPMQFKGASQLTVRANTVVGDLPSGSFGFRIGTEGDNPTMSDITMRNSIYCDPTGSMTNRLVNVYGDVTLATLALENNLYWNDGGALPTGGDINPADDPAAIDADPLLPEDQSSVTLPVWDDQTHQFASGSTTIRDEFLRLVETYGAIADSSPAIGAADSSDMPGDDIRGLARDGSPDIGAYEHGATEPATGGGGASSSSGSGAGTSSGSSGSGAGTSSGSSTDWGSEEDSGCGCRLVGRGSLAGGAAFSLLVFLGLARRRRQRRN